MARGISTVIATILLLVMVVVITAGVFYFFRGTMGTATATGQQKITESITETDVQSGIQITSWRRTNNKNLSLTIINKLDDNITLTRVDIEGQQVEFIDCDSGAVLETQKVTIQNGNVKDVCVKYPYNNTKAGNKVTLYVRYKNKPYVIQTYLP